jgi:hypothetical protein
MSTNENGPMYPTAKDVRYFDSPDIGLSPEGERVARTAALEFTAKQVAVERARREEARSRQLEPPVEIEPVTRELPATDIEVTE